MSLFPEPVTYDGRTDSGRTSSGRNPAFNLYYIYIFIHRCINFFAILVSQVRCYCNQYLLSFIVTMYWTEFLYELYSNSRVLIHYIECHYFILFIVSIIGCHNCSCPAILKFSSMTLSLSLSFMCIGYCAIELRIYPSWYL